MQNVLIKERFQLAENLRSARCSPFVISEVPAARIRKLITARARKSKRTARMLANACADHSVPLISTFPNALNSEKAKNPEMSIFFEKHVHLSNRPQVSVGYKLINHAGC